MIFNKQTNDPIMAIVNTIRPLAYRYSKGLKKLDKEFKDKSINHLKKCLQIKPKLQDFYSVPKIEINKNCIDVNLKNSYKYADDLSDFNNLPMVLQKKIVLKEGQIDPDYEYNINMKKITKKVDLKPMKNIIKHNERIAVFQRLNKLLEARSLEPLKYTPNYDFVKQRTPVAYLGRGKGSNRFNNEYCRNRRMLIMSKSENDIRSTSKKNNRKDNSKDNTNPSPSVIINTGVNKNSDSVLEGKPREDPLIKRYKKFNININCNQDSCTSEEEDAQKVSNIQNIKSTDNIKPKKHRKANSLLRTPNKLTRNCSDLTLNKKKLPFLERQNERSNSKKNNESSVKSNSKNGHIQGSVVFNKMSGRQGKVISNASQRMKSCISPNYKCLEPHIPQTKFCFSPTWQEYKKAKTYKLIRSYSTNPESYFVMDANKYNK